jgi:Zn-dependent protease with chaperone function
MGVLVSQLLRCCRSRILILFWIFLSIAGVVVAVVRISTYYQTPGPFDPAMQGFCDFHNGVYFPSLGFARRVSPYSQNYADTFPVSRQVPPYSPLIIALHVPFALLSLEFAEVCYFLFMIVCIVAIAWVLVRDAPNLPTATMCAWIWPVVAIIVWSRPGHISLYNGYFTFELVLGTFVALSTARSRPWLAAIGIALASGKPTYFLPLCVLMVARGDYGAIVRGMVLAIVGGLASMFWITGFSLSAVNQIIQDVLGGQAVHMNDPFESPVTSWIRIDIAAVVAKVINRDLNEWVQIGLMLFFLAVPAGVLWRNRKRFRDPCLTDLSGSLVIVASVVAIYHNAYDAILLMAPIVGWACTRWDRQQEHKRTDLMVVGLLMIPMFNPFSTYTMLQRFQIDSWLYQVVTSSNAVAIFLAAVLLIWRVERTQPVIENS